MSTTPAPSNSQSQPNDLHPAPRAIQIRAWNAHELASQFVVRGVEHASQREHGPARRVVGEAGQFSRLGDFFFRLLGQGSTLLVSDIDQDDWRTRLPAGFLATVLPQGFILSPLLVGSRSIGFLYADRLRGQGAISVDDFRGFNRFFLQARLALAYAGPKGKRT